MDLVHLGLLIFGVGGQNIVEFFLMVVLGIWSDINKLVHVESDRSV